MGKPEGYLPITRWRKVLSYVADIQMTTKKAAERLSAPKGRDVIEPAPTHVEGRIGEAFGDAVREYEKAGRPRQVRTNSERTASELFNEIFGRVTPVVEDRGQYRGLGGHSKYPAGQHPDNEAAMLTLYEPLRDVLQYPGGQNERWASVQTAQPRGDLLLVGGPHTTPLSMLAFELKAERASLDRRASPALKLPFFKVIESHPIGAGLVGRVLENAEGRGKHAFVTTTRWAFLDTYYDSWRRPGTRKANSAEKWLMPSEYCNQRMLLRNDYLLITQLPNFLQADEGFLRSHSPEDWPRLTLVAGLHGIGTRGLELLLSDDGLQALEAIAERVVDEDKIRPFQALARVDEVELTSGRFHKANTITIDIDDVRPLPFIEKDRYLNARAFAERQLPYLPPHSSAPHAKPSAADR